VRALTAGVGFADFALKLLAVVTSVRAMIVIFPHDDVTR
jgi:hypothetical protein